MTDVFRNVRVTRTQTHNFCNMVDDVLESDVRLTLLWAALPGYWGLMASAAEHAHCNTTAESALILPE